MWFLALPFLIYSAPLENLNSDQLIAQESDVPQRYSPAEPLDLGAGQTVVIRETVFDGNDAITTGELNKLAKPFLHRPFSQRDLRELEGRIRVYYRGKGYREMVLTSAVERHFDHYLLYFNISEGRRDPSRQY